MSSSMMRAAFSVLVFCGGGCGAVDDGEDRAVACEGGTVDVLANGNFDAVDPPWVQDPPGLLCGAPEIVPDSGTTAACLGGMDGMINTVSQEVPLPAGASSARLTGRICIATVETDPVDADRLTIDLVAGVAAIGTFAESTNQQGADPCQFVNLLLETPLSDDPVTATLRLQSTLDPQRPTSFFVDSLTLTVACE